MFKKVFLLLFLFFLPFFNTNSFAEKINYTRDNSLEEGLHYINFEWWFNFKDQNLQKYILKGLLNNNDLKIANLKLEEYKNFVKYTFGQELPVVSMDANYFNVKKIPFGVDKINQDGFILPITMSYELDFFGKNRSKTKATRKQLEAYKYQLQSTYISYASNLATLYFNIVKVNKLIELSDKILEIKQNIVDDLIINEKNGLATKSDINKAEQDLIEFRNNELILLKNKNNLLTQFAVYLGENPYESYNFTISDFKNINFNSNLPINVSSSYIFERPDVLVYEKQMEKAKIDISVARKEFLPTFNINGTAIFNNIASGGFFSTAKTITSLVAGASQSLFIGGRKKANLDMMNLRYEQMFENYKKITLQATKEINDSLASLIYSEKIKDEAKKSLVLEKENFLNYQISHKNGLISKVELDKLRQQLILKEIALVEARIQEYVDFISLYKSVGGQLK